MAGSNPGFDPTAFRDAIHLAMGLGAPPDASQRVTFYWDTQVAFDTAVTALDAAGRPFDWTAPSDDTVPVPTSLALTNVAIDLGSLTGGTGTPMGRFDDSHGMLTLLDVDYAAVSSATHVKYAGRVYEMQEPEPLGLFDVTVWQIPIVEADRSRRRTV